MGKKIPEAQRTLAIQQLANRETERSIASSTGINRTSLQALKPEANQLKKDIAADFHVDTAERISSLAKKMLSIVESGAEVLTEDVIKAQSGAAIATTMGILVDKMQLLTGGATENVQISAGPKAQDFLQKLKAKSIRIESANIDAELAGKKPPTEK
jgi:hypothetical protein